LRCPRKILRACRVRHKNVSRTDRRAYAMSGEKPKDDRRPNNCSYSSTT
jgi:hypothetical protein